jgi:hypothetical protein
MWIAVGLLVVLGLILFGGWLVDRRAAKRGLKVHIQHTGLRREVTYTKIDKDDHGDVPRG